MFQMKSESKFTVSTELSRAPKTESSVTLL